MTPARGATARRPAARSRSASRAAARRRRAKARAERSRRVRRWLFAGGLLVGVVVIAVAAWQSLSRDGQIPGFGLPLEHADIIRAEADDPDTAHTLSGDIELPPIDPALIAGVIFQESKFLDQTSDAGARGLMQITPDTADTIESLSGGSTFTFDDLADPELNIRYGTFYLRYLMDKYGGDEAAALAAYNAGEGNADEWGGADLELSDITFPETRAYVDEVLEKQEQYRKEYAEELGIR